jgi:CTP synthase
MTHPATSSFHCTSLFPLLDAKYEAILTGGGPRITGTTPDATYVEIPTHLFFLGCQIHPEFKSKSLEPHPIFRDFIAASYQNHLRLTPDLIAEDARTSNQ